jgi:hypothetical protein
MATKHSFKKRQPAKRSATKSEKQILLTATARLQQRPPAQSKHIGRNIIIVISLLVLGFICFRIAINITSRITAFANVTTARQQAIISTDKQLASQILALQQAGLIGHLIAQSKLDVCYTDHNDQGWLAANWYQNCYLRYVSGYTTNQDKTAVLEKLTALQGIFGQVQNTPYEQQVSPCDLAEINYQESVRYRVANSNITESNECGMPDPVQGVFIGPDPALESNDQMSVQKFYSYATTHVDNSHDQLWIIHNDSYYHEELGCGIGIFCENPRVRPVQAR